MNQKESSNYFNIQKQKIESRKGSIQQLDTPLPKKESKRKQTRRKFR